jgi:cytochrome c(L)
MHETRFAAPGRPLVLLIALLSILAGMLALDIHASQDAPLRNPFADDAAAIEKGKVLFVRTDCYTCHGSDLHGAVGPDLTDDVWIVRPTDEALFRTIKFGRSGTLMAGFGDQLSDEQIWQLLAFIRSKYSGDPAKKIW